MSYQGHVLGVQRLDIVVDRQLIVELKATEALAPYARRQLLSYLTATGLDIGLLLHFGPKPKFFRVANFPNPDQSPT